MNFDEIRTKLKTKCVGIAGCGGIGSNAAISLSRIGIGTLIIADYDKVESDNLNRQYFFLDQIGKSKATALKENILKINRSINVYDHKIKLGPKEIINLYSDCDVIIEAFDDAGMKEMLIETMQTELPQISIVSGIGMAGWSGNDSINIRQYGNLFFVGDGKSEVSESHPPIAPRVGIVANMMANLVLELLLGKDELNENNT